MKNPKITLTKDGLKLIDAPEKPIINLPYNRQQYYKALQKAIEQGVEIKGAIGSHGKMIDKDDLNFKMLICLELGGFLEPGKLYDIPTNYHVVIKGKVDCTNESCDGECGSCSCMEKEMFAVLEPLTKQEPEQRFLQPNGTTISQMEGITNSLDLDIPLRDENNNFGKSGDDVLIGLMVVTILACIAGTAIALYGSWQLQTACVIAILLFVSYLYLRWKLRK